MADLFDRLPFEILEGTILEMLFLEDKINLALTCKDLYSRLEKDVQCQYDEIRKLECDLISAGHAGTGMFYEMEDEDCGDWYDYAEDIGVSTEFAADCSMVPENTSRDN
jgi:hypothetical protein